MVCLHASPEFGPCCHGANLIPSFDTEEQIREAWPLKCCFVVKEILQTEIAYVQALADIIKVNWELCCKPLEGGMLGQRLIMKIMGGMLGQCLIMKIIGATGPVSNYENHGGYWASV